MKTGISYVSLVNIVRTFCCCIIITWNQNSLNIRPICGFLIYLFIFSIYILPANPMLVTKPTGGKKYNTYFMWHVQRNHQTHPVQNAICYMKCIHHGWNQHRNLQKEIFHNMFFFPILFHVTDILSETTLSKICCLPSIIVRLSMMVRVVSSPSWNARGLGTLV